MPKPLLANLRTRLAQACLNLVQIPSVTGREAAITDHLQTWALTLKHVHKDDVVRRGNALVVGSADPRRPCVALVGHTDTVPPNPATPRPFQEGDRVVGLGATDMKSGLAVMKILMETLNLPALPFNVMLIFYDREEGSYQDNGLQPLLDTAELLHDIDLAIVLEPTDNTLQLGCLGSIQARIVFHGQAAHSARPWQGENAIHKAGPFLTQMLHRPINEVTVDGLVFRESMSVTVAKGGQARNVIADSFELNVNYRFAPLLPLQKTIERASQEVFALTNGAADVSIIDSAPPGPVPSHNPIFSHWRGLTGLAVEPKQAWTDVARLAARGIDAVNFGPGITAQAHQATEWVSIDAMVQSYQALAQLLTTPLPPGGSPR